MKQLAHVLILTSGNALTTQVLGIYESQEEARHYAQISYNLDTGNIDVLKFEENLDKNDLYCNIPCTEETYLIQSI